MSYSSFWNDCESNYHYLLLRNLNHLNRSFISNLFELTLHKKWSFPLSRYNQIRSFLWIWWHLMRKSLTENFLLLCSVTTSGRANCSQQNLNFQNVTSTKANFGKIFFNSIRPYHCVKGVRIRNYSASYLPHLEWIRTRITQNTETSHEV